VSTKSERLQERHKARYRELDKNVKRMARAAKRAYVTWKTLLDKQKKANKETYIK
jgi:hypothetical protein